MPLGVELSTQCVLEQPAFEAPFWTGVRSCIRSCTRFPSPQLPVPKDVLVHLAVLTACRRLSEEGRRYSDDLLPILAHFTTLYLSVPTTTRLARKARGLLVESLSNLCVCDLLDPTPLLPFIPSQPKTQEEEEETLAWIDGCIGTTRFSSRMAEMAWRLTFSKRSETVAQALELLLVLEPQQLETVLLRLTGREDTEALKLFLLRRIGEFSIDEEAHDLFVQLGCVIEGTQAVRVQPVSGEEIMKPGSGEDIMKPVSEEEKMKPVSEEEKMKPGSGEKENTKQATTISQQHNQPAPGSWSDPNELFNSCMNNVGLLLPLGCFVPSDVAAFDGYVCVFDFIVAASPISWQHLPS